MYQAIIPNNILNPLIEIIIMVLFIVLMLFCFKKLSNVRSFLAMLLILLISCVIGVESIKMYDLPFTPWIQLFFILFQLVIFGLKVNDPE